MRLYYDDAYTREFTARIVERLTLDGHPAVILDRTYFYPTSGGQPNDTGTLGGAAVLDVQARKDDGAVVHVLDGEIASDEVDGVVDWARRFDSHAAPYRAAYSVAGVCADRCRQYGRLSPGQRQHHD